MVEGVQQGPVLVGTFFNGDPLPLSFRSNVRSFVVSMILTIDILSPWVVVDFCPYGTTNFLCAILAYFCL